MTEATDPDAVLARSLVSIEVLGAGRGTGFFITPTVILTCAHVVAGAEQGKVSIFHELQHHETQVSEIHPPNLTSDNPIHPYPDLALIDVAGVMDSSPLPIELSLPRLDDRLHSVGYSNPTTAIGGLEPSTFVAEGLHEFAGGRFLKLGAGANALPGMSGGPLVNLRSGRVCGILKTSRNPSFPHGGWAIPLAALEDCMPSILRLALHQKPNAAWIAAFPTSKNTVPEELENYVPLPIATLLAQSRDCLEAALIISRKERASFTDGGIEHQVGQILRLASVVADPEAFRLLNSRDGLMLLALAWGLCKKISPTELRTAVEQDKYLRRTWIAFAHSIDAMPLEEWKEATGNFSPTETPRLYELEALSTDLTDANRSSADLFINRHREEVVAALSRGQSALPDPAEDLGFPDFYLLLRGITANIGKRSDDLASELRSEFGEAKHVSGCHLLYVALLFRATFSLRHLLDVSPDGVLIPAQTNPPGEDFATASHAIGAVHFSSEEEGEIVHLLCSPKSPRELQSLKAKIETSRATLTTTAATLARVYRLGREARYRFRFEILRSNIDDARRYVEESALPFEPELGRMALRASGVLPLFVRPLYGRRPEIGVRELLQNSLDAVWARRVIQGTAQTLTSLPDRIAVITTDRSGVGMPQLQGSVSPPKEWSHWIEVSDTGIGMTSEVVREHFLTVGGTFDPTADLIGQLPLRQGRQQRIGRFGVGVCAAFLLGTEVQVITRHLSEPVDHGLCLRLVERDDFTEMYRCSAPVGTTVRVRLSEKDYKRFEAQPHIWEWFGRSDPDVERAIINNGGYRKLPSTLSGLTQFSVTREINIPPYGTVRWAPSPQPFKAHIFVNGIRVVSLHQNFDFNVMKPTEQLNQPVIDIDDASGSLDLLLTRDNFATLPMPIFSAVRRDAITDHLAWLANCAQSALHKNLPWKSHLWEVKAYSQSQGDGTVSAMPYILTNTGLVPLDPRLLENAGVREIDFLMVRGSMKSHDEPGAYYTNPPDWDAGALMSVPRLSAESAIGFLRVDMNGGFGYHPFAAGIDQVFSFGSGLGAELQLQLVTNIRGTDFAKMFSDAVVGTWGDSLLLRERFMGRGRHNQSEEDRLASIHTAEGLTSNILDKLEKQNGPTSGRHIKHVVGMNCYGLLHVWLKAPNEKSAKQVDSELSDVWRMHRFPPALPLGSRGYTESTPLAAELQHRMERVAREEAIPYPAWDKVPGKDISTPKWTAF